MTDVRVGQVWTRLSDHKSFKITRISNLNTVEMHSVVDGWHVILTVTEYVPVLFALETT